MIKSLVLRILRTVTKTPNVLGFLAVLPFFTEGTAVHDDVVALRPHIALGILNYEAFAWWAKQSIAWSEAKGMDWGRDPRFLLTPLPVLPVVTIWSYLAVRLFEHPGEWKVIFAEFSGSTLLGSVVVCSLGMALAYLVTMTLVRVSRGEHPFLADHEPPARWKIVVILLGMPGFFLAVLLLQKLVRMLLGTG